MRTATTGKMRENCRQKKKKRTNPNNHAQVIYLLLHEKIMNVSFPVTNNFITTSTKINTNTLYRETLSILSISKIF